MPPKKKRLTRARKPKPGLLVRRKANPGQQGVSIVIDQRKYTNRRTNQIPPHRQAAAAKDTYVVGGRSGGLYESAFAPKQQNDLLASALIKTLGAIQKQNTLGDKTFKDSATQAVRMTPDASLTPATMVVRSLQTMREFLLGNKDHIKAVVKRHKNSSYEKLTDYVNDLQSNGLQQLYLKVRTYQDPTFLSPSSTVALSEPPSTSIRELQRLTKAAEQEFDENFGEGGERLRFESDDEGDH